VYILYMDASGDPGEYQPGKNSRYYVLCGLACQPGTVQTVAPQFEAIVATSFGTAGVKAPARLHYWELIKGDNPYSKIDRKKLADDVFNLVVRTRCDLLGVCLDKPECRRRYGGRMIPPVDHALEAIAMKFQTYLETKRDLGMIVSDREDASVERSLRELFHRFKRQGTRFKKIQDILDGLYFAPSSNAPCLQLADFCAYAIRVAYERGDRDRFSQIEFKFKKSGGLRNLP